MERRLTKSEVADAFVEDSDVIEATRMWAMGLYSNQELTDKLSYYRLLIDQREIEVDDDDSGLDRPYGESGVV